jgi:glutamyl-tRNA synthetase
VLFNKDYFKKIAKLEQERLKKFSEIGERTKYFFEAPEYDGKILIWKKSDATKTKKILGDLQNVFSNLADKDFEIEVLEPKVKDFIAQNNLDNGSVLWPMRVALTGLEKSPSPFEVASVLAFGLGKQEIINRLKAAENKL